MSKLSKFSQWLIITASIFLVFGLFFLFTSEKMYFIVAAILSFVSVFIVDDEEDPDTLEAIKNAENKK